MIVTSWNSSGMITSVVQAPAISSLLIWLMLCLTETSLSLRQDGTTIFICSSFFARGAKNELQEEEKYHCEKPGASTVHAVLLTQQFMHNAGVHYLLWLALLQRRY